MNLAYCNIQEPCRPKRLPQKGGSLPNRDTHCEVASCDLSPPDSISRSELARTGPRVFLQSLCTRAPYVPVMRIDDRGRYHKRGDGEVLRREGRGPSRRFGTPKGARTVVRKPKGVIVGVLSVGKYSFALDTSMEGGRLLSRHAPPLKMAKPWEAGVVAGEQLVRDAGRRARLLTYPISCANL